MYGVEDVSEFINQTFYLELLLFEGGSDPRQGPQVLQSADSKPKQALLNFVDLVEVEHVEVNFRVEIFSPVSGGLDLGGDVVGLVIFEHVEVEGGRVHHVPVEGWKHDIENLLKNVFDACLPLFAVGSSSDLHISSNIL